jgi:hypothetical protein
MQWGIIVEGMDEAIKVIRPARPRLGSYRMAWFSLLMPVVVAVIFFGSEFIAVKTGLVTDHLLVVELGVGGLALLMSLIEN